MKQKPIFRADHVGSLLRTDDIKKARKACLEDKTISPNELLEVENTEIRKVIEKYQPKEILTTGPNEKV